MIENFFHWMIDNAIALVALVISLITIVITISLNRRESPTIMPDGEEAGEGNHLSFKFKNTSEFTLLTPSILIHSFDTELNEISKLNFADRYNFNLSPQSVVHYGFFISNYANKGMFVRIRFASVYRVRLPFFRKQTFQQELWYSLLPIMQNGDKIYIKVSTTHCDEIEKLKIKHGDLLRKYDSEQDGKFKK